jgi:hypothetical protein
MNNIAIPLNLLSLFSADRQVYRAFGYLIAARIGTLLLVPPHLVLGDLAKVIDGSPVPGEEVYAVLEYPPVHQLTNPAAWPSSNDHVQQLEYLGMDPSEFEIDTISPMVRGREKVLRLVHPSGVRYAVVMS